VLVDHWVGRKIDLAQSVEFRILEFYHSLAAEVSTLGGTDRLGFNRPGPLLGACWVGILSKLLFDSGGGVPILILAFILHTIRYN
jgi:hypothetical protein